jgi:hypothetical protein
MGEHAPMNRRALLAPLAPFLWSRLLVFGILFAVSNVAWYQRAGYTYVKFKHKPFIETVTVGDAIYYQDIALHGYTTQTAAFLPFWPLVLKIVNGNLLGGTVIANLCFYLALVFLYCLVPDKKVLWYVCLFPASYFLSLPLSESLFLFLIVLAFSLPMVGILASATRLEGVALFPALLIQRKWLASLIPLGFLSFMIYLRYALGDNLAFVHAHALFGRSLGGGFSVGIFPGWSCVPLSLAALTLWVWAIVILVRDREWSYAVYAGASLALPLVSGLAALPRFASASFPIFVALARQRYDLRVVFAVGLTILTLLFALRVVFAVA